MVVAEKPIPVRNSLPNGDLIDFTLSNAKQFYSSKGDPLGVKGLKHEISMDNYKGCNTENMEKMF